MFFRPSIFDALTLDYLRKSLPNEEIGELEAIGAFDLIKSSNLHPQKVLCHGPHGPYYATRMVSNGDTPSASAMPHPSEDAESGHISTLKADIEKYSGRSFKDVYAEEGEEGVMKAMGAQYAKGSTPSSQMDRLEEFYGVSEEYTPEAAAYAVQLWTNESLPVPGTEDMDQDELAEWYENEGYKGYESDGRIWACSLIREMSDRFMINEQSESEITAATAAHIIDRVIENKGKVHDGPIYRGVVMPEGTIDDIVNGGSVDLGGITSFSRDQYVALGFLEDSPEWSRHPEGTVPEQIVFVLDSPEGVKSYEIRQSGFMNEQENIVSGHEPFGISRVTVDDIDGPNILEEPEPADGNDEDESDYFDDYEDDPLTNPAGHVFYVYLKKEEQ